MIARRTVQVLVAVIAAFILTLSSADAQQVRMRWQDFISGPDGARRLASLMAAVAKMKSLDATDPVQDPVNYRRSWHYWANIHGYYGSQSPDGTIQQQIDYLNSHGLARDVKYYDGSTGDGPPITDQTPPDDIAQKIWATCEHGDDANFFGWHRMYLYYFERVLRWAANDDTLRLPYWDYTDPTQEAIPAAFQDVASVLYDPKRQPRINNGSATLNPNATNVNDDLKEPDYHTYENDIQDNIHGYVHCTVGPTCPVAHMGDVPVAGNDPVFYVHHANIDRLWACWQQSNVTPPGTWQDQTFSFVDETGTLVTRPVKDFLDSTTLGYVYDNVSSCARPTLVASDRVAQTQTVTPRSARDDNGQGSRHRKHSHQDPDDQCQLERADDPACRPFRCRTWAGGKGPTRPARHHRGQPSGHDVQRLPGEDGQSGGPPVRRHDFVVQRFQPSPPSPGHGNASDEDANLRRHRPAACAWQRYDRLRTDHGDRGDKRAGVQQSGNALDAA